MCTSNLTLIKVDGWYQTVNNVRLEFSVRAWRTFTWRNQRYHIIGLKLFRLLHTLTFYKCNKCNVINYQNELDTLIQVKANTVYLSYTKNKSCAENTELLVNMCLKDF